MALRQHGEGLDAYMDKFMELYAQVPDMSPQYFLAIYLGGLEASVRIHLLGAQHVSTSERALEETRIYANAHRGFGVRASGQYETGDDPMNLTVQMPVVRQAASARPGSRVSFGVSIAAGWATCATRVRYHAGPNHHCRRAVMVCTPHDRGGPTRTPFVPGMCTGNVLYAVPWVIWRRIAIHVREVLVPDPNNGSPDHRGVR